MTDGDKGACDLVSETKATAKAEDLIDAAAGDHIYGDEPIDVNRRDRADKLRHVEQGAVRRAPEGLLAAIRLEFHKLIDGDDFPENLVQLGKLAASTRELLLTIGLPPGILSRRERGLGSLGTGAEVEGDGSLSPFMTSSYGGTGGTGFTDTVPSYMSAHRRKDPEQFGARAIRELVNLVPDVARSVADAIRPAPSAADLVKAISTAKENGLGDLASVLERRLLASLDPSPKAVAGHASESPAPEDHSRSNSNGVAAVGIVCSSSDVGPS
jgi:hypothetical protein